LQRWAGQADSVHRRPGPFGHRARRDDPPNLRLLRRHRTTRPVTLRQPPSPTSPMPPAIQTAPRPADHRPPLLPPLRQALRRSARSGCPRPRPTSSSRRQRRRDQPPARPPKLQRQERRRDQNGRGVSPHRKRHADTPLSIRGKKSRMNVAGEVSSGLDWRAALDAPRGGKRCSRCSTWLPPAAFGANPRLSSGLNSWCRSCQREGMREWRGEHREELNAKRRGAVSDGVCRLRRDVRGSCAQPGALSGLSGGDVAGAEALTGVAWLVRLSTAARTTVVSVG
jgi:hypothetical protein